VPESERAIISAVKAIFDYSLTRVRVCGDMNGWFGKKRRIKKARGMPPRQFILLMIDECMGKIGSNCVALITKAIWVSLNNNTGWKYKMKEK
jgi:hypothetical protein